MCRRNGSILRRGPVAEAPYTSEATAATNLADLVAYTGNGTEILVLDGEHALDRAVIFDRRVTIRSKSRSAEKASFYRLPTATMEKMIDLTGAGSDFAYLTVSNHSSAAQSYAGAAVSVIGGTLGHCHFTKNAGLSLSSNGSVVSNCLFDANSAWNYSVPSFWQQGAAARIEDCVVSRNTTQHYSDGAALADGGEVCRLKFLDNQGTSSGGALNVRGRTRVDGNRRDCLYVESFERRGCASVPALRDASVAEVARGERDMTLVRVRGLVRDTFKDEIDAGCSHLILVDGAAAVSVAISGATNAPALKRLIGATVRVTGACLPHNGGWRVFNGSGIEVRGLADIAVVTPAPADPFAAELLGDLHHVNTEAIARLGRRSAVGRVRAVWSGNRFLLRTADGTLIRVTLADGERPPACGDFVRVVGFPSTDLFNINLLSALWRHEDRPPARAEQPADVSAAQLFADQQGQPRFTATYNGRLVRIRGVVRIVDTDGFARGRMDLDCDGHTVNVDASARPDALAGITIGCVVELTGVCLMETNLWKPDAIFPRIVGVMIVPRDGADVRVLSRPPWWTTGRLLAVIGSLLAALAAILVWNRILNRLVDRRSRELLREQVAHLRADLRTRERTNLAVELHDALSQNLAALACQIAAGRSALATVPEAAARQFETAERMLLSCRTELRRCLWDLRGEALEAKDFTGALKTVLGPVAGKAVLSVRFNVPRTRVNDTTAHAILCIVRELVSNAVRHGHAANVRIAGEMHDGRISFSVRDDGCGFDPGKAQGLAEGHFGLQGIRERVRRLDGTFELDSAPGRGTRTAITLLHDIPTT